MIVTRNGKPVAALLAVRDDEEVERLVLAHSPRLRSSLDTARRRIREGDAIGHDEFWRGVGTELSEKKRSSKGNEG